jgi:hypothetical protein
LSYRRRAIFGPFWHSFSSENEDSQRSLTKHERPLATIAARDFGDWVRSKCALNLILEHFSYLTVANHTYFTEKNDLRPLWHMIELDLEIRFVALKKDERYIFWTNGHSGGRTGMIA